MQSDKQFYEIFEVNPQWLFELTGRRSPGPCKFVSITLKAIERRSDGLLLPELTSQPITIAELQMQADSEVYLRTVIEMAMVQAEHADRQLKVSFCLAHVAWILKLNLGSRSLPATILMN